MEYQTFYIIKYWRDKELFTPALCTLCKSDVFVINVMQLQLLL